MDDIKEHEQKLLDAFGQVLRAEDELAAAKKRLAEAEAELKPACNAAEHTLRQAWDVIQAVLAETGEVEAILPGAVTDYKVGWSNPPERVKCDPDAVPDGFCKVERKPMLKEIGDHLKSLREAGADMPNWASLERGEPKLGWKAIKRKHKE